MSAQMAGNVQARELRETPLVLFPSRKPEVIDLLFLGTFSLSSLDFTMIRNTIEIYVGMLLRRRFAVSWTTFAQALRQ